MQNCTEHQSPSDKWEALSPEECFMMIMDYLLTLEVERANPGYFQKYLQRIRSLPENEEDLPLYGALTELSFYKTTIEEASLGNLPPFPIIREAAELVAVAGSEKRTILLDMYPKILAEEGSSACQIFINSAKVILSEE